MQKHMFTTLSKLAMYLMVVAATPACDSGGSQSPLSKINVVGKWVCSQSMIETTYEFRDDGTCTKSVKVASDLPPEPPLNGTWKINHADMLLHIKWPQVEETRQITLVAGIPSFAGEGQQIFYQKR